MNVRPLHDRIIVHRLDEGEQQIGGIIIPDTAKEKPQHGTVIAAGNGKVKDDGKRIPLDVKAGDRILFGKYSGQEIKLDGDMAPIGDLGRKTGWDQYWEARRSLDRVPSNESGQRSGPRHASLGRLHRRDEGPEGCPLAPWRW